MHLVWEVSPKEGQVDVLLSNIRLFEQSVLLSCILLFFSSIIVLCCTEVDLDVHHHHRGDCRELGQTTTNVEEALKDAIY